MADRPTVLIGTRSPAARDELLRLAAAAHVEPLVVTDPAAARRWWAEAGMVVVDEAYAASLSPPPSRRSAVALVARDHDAAAYRQALAVGAEHVATLPDGSAWIGEAMAAAGDGCQRGLTVSVVGCRGGAGTSVLVAGLARQAGSDGLTAVAVDADPTGADLDLVLDMVDEPGLRWGDLATAAGRIPAAPLAASLPQRDGVCLLAPGHDLAAEPPARPGPISEECVGSVVAALGSVFDLVLVDVPRWLPDLARPALRAADVVLLVTSADPRGAAAAQRLAASLRRDGADLRLVVQTGPGTAADADEVARMLDVPLVAAVRDDSRVRADGARGDLVMRATLRRAARSILEALAAAAPVGVR